MTEFDVFKYGVLSVTGLVIIGLIWAYISNTADDIRETEFLDRVVRGPKQDVRAWVEQHEEEVDYMPYTATTLYVHINGDPEARSFSYSKFEPACEKLIRAGVRIKDPTSGAARIRQKLASSPSKQPRV